jgi:hypothetical protein
LNSRNLQSKEDEKAKSQIGRQLEAYESLNRKGISDDYDDEVYHSLKPTTTIGQIREIRLKS